MNENIDLTKILKDCPKGTKLYSTVFGEVEFDKIDNISLNRPIVVSHIGEFERFVKDGRLFYRCDGECVLFPSTEQRDWSKFTAPWLKKKKFDPKTLQPFDRILVRDHNGETWSCNFFSHIREVVVYKFMAITYPYKQCIPYNDETKHLVGTTEEAPEFYRYWED